MMCVCTCGCATCIFSRLCSDSFFFRALPSVSHDLNVAVLHSMIEQLEFANLEFDEALRCVLVYS